jgi:hypothetical protein
MQSRHLRILAPLLSGAALAAFFTGSAAGGAPTPKHLAWAERLVATVTPAANEYGDPAQITWKTKNGLDHSTNTSKCASLLTRMMATAYGEQFIGWLGCKSPNAATYHDAIEEEDGFVRVESIHDVMPGDIIAIRYFDAGCVNVTCGSFTGCQTSGHVAIVAARPAGRVATSPVVAGTTQFAVEVIDSSRDIHGVGDTRHEADLLGADDEGVGRGTMRLYIDTTDPAHPILGYTWSTWSGSVFHTSETRDLVIGRLRR